MRFYNFAPKITRETIRKNPVSFNLGCLIGHNSVFSKVALVSNKNLVYIFTRVTINFTQPLFDIVEALLVCYIINYLQDTYQTPR